MDNNELKSVLEQLSNEEEQNNNNQNEKRKRVNADYLNILANVDIVLSIIGTVWLLINSIADEINWIGIISAIVVLISGTTLFFLLKTIVDIYREVEK